jgi:hypothetical protein
MTMAMSVTIAVVVLVVLVRAVTMPVRRSAGLCVIVVTGLDVRPPGCWLDPRH